MSIEQPFLDLRDQAHPHLLRVLAIGAPNVVEDYMLKTIF